MTIREQQNTLSFIFLSCTIPLLLSLQSSLSSLSSPTLTPFHKYYFPKIQNPSSHSHSLINLQYSQLFLFYLINIIATPSNCPMREAQLSPCSIKLYQTTESYFPKIPSAENQALRVFNETISPEADTQSFYELLRNGSKQLDKLSHMDIMSRMIKILKVVIGELEQYTKYAYLLSINVACLPGIFQKSSSKISFLLSQLKKCKEELSNKSQCTVTPILARRFITRIIQTLTIIKNRYGNVEQPITLEQLYKNYANPDFLKLQNFMKIVGSLVLGIYQEFNFSKKNSNDEIVNIAYASVQTTIRLLQKYHLYISKYSNTKTGPSTPSEPKPQKNKISSVMERAYRERSSAAKRLKNSIEIQSPSMQKNPTVIIQKSLSLYSGMNIDIQHLRSIVMQSKHHCVDIKDNLLEQNGHISKAIQQYQNNFQKWRQKINKRKEKKLRKQKLLSSNKAANKLNCVRLVGKSEDKSTKKFEVRGRQNEKQSKNQLGSKSIIDKQLKECPSAPIREKSKQIRQKSNNIARISFCKGKRNFLEVKPVTVTGDEFMYTNSKLVRENEKKQKGQKQKREEKIERQFIRDQEILQLVKGISKKNTNLLYRGFKIPADRVALLRRKSTSSKNERLVTE